MLSVARLAPEKGHDTLIAAAALLADPRVVVLLAGGGPERERLEALAAELGARLVVLPELSWERIVERYAIADVFALLSRHEPWGVAVNEAAACGLPLVLSDRVGAAFDLLEDGSERRARPRRRSRMRRPTRSRRSSPTRSGASAAGAASRELMRGWGYEPSIENLVSGRAARRRASGRERLLVDRDLLADDRVPGRSPGSVERAFGEPRPQRGVAEHARDRLHRR